MTTKNRGPYSVDFPEREAAIQVKSGVLRLDADGSVWRLQERPGGGPLRPCKPRRIDYVSNIASCYFRITPAAGGSKKCFVHRLVWQLAHGDIPPRMTVNHKDGNRRNNALENLELATHSDNHKHRYRELGQEAPARTNKRFAKLFAAAARAALAGDLEPLREVLAAYDARPLSAVSRAKEHDS